MSWPPACPYPPTWPGNCLPCYTATIRRQILAVVDGGPCRAPVTFRIGDTTATVACGRREPAERQCPACRVIVTEQSITSHHHGYEGPAHRRPDTSGAN